uniref:Uroporphyrinogen decarboxylase (URO-D) domain-containing protein n=2 Tax=Lotharella globosa TaxID=91324 RepID=A0A7S4DSX3_9EUKA
MHTAESNGRENALEFIKKYPEAATKILDNATKLVVKYLIAKVEAGAQMLQVFDSWAGILSKDDFDTFSKPYLLKVKLTISCLLTNTINPSTSIHPCPDCEGGQGRN